MASRFSIEAVVSMIDRVSNPMKNAGNSVAAFHQKSEKHFGGISSIAGTAFKSLGIIGGGAAIVMGFKKIISEAANFENSVASFTTLLGGSDTAAKKLVNDLQVLGAETPFEFKDLAAATQRLLGFGVVTKDTAIPTLRMLGDLAQGNAEKLQGISLVYGQIMAGGKMMGQDFNQLINQGVPIAQGLAKVWGVDVNEAIKRVKQNGPVAAKDVQAAMIQMTSAGGLFYQGMMRSSKTLTGLWSTFQDAISMTAGGIGQELLPTIKDLVISMTEGATSVLKWVQDNKAGIESFVGAIKTVLSIVWSLRYAVLALAIATGIWKALILAGQFAEFLTMLKAFKMEYVKMIAAQWGLNVAMLANPITWIVLGIAVLIAALVALYMNWDTVTAFLSSAWESVKTGFVNAMTSMWEGLKSLGQGILSVLLAPMNLLISGIISLLNLASNIPGVGDKFKAAADWAQGMQNKMNGTLGVTTPTQFVQGMASPVSNQIANGGGNSINGRVGIDINSNVPGTTMVQDSLPSFLKPTLNTGLQP